MTISGSCAVPDCGAGLREDEPGRGARLCPSCLHGLADRLTGLPALYLACESVLVGSRPGTWGRRPSGTRPRGIDLDEPAVNARAESLHVLACWAGLVVDERAVRPPRREVPALTDFLTLHLDWLVSSPLAGELAVEIEAVTATARTAVRRVRTEAPELGTCDRPGCAGTVRAVYDTDDRRGRPDVRCDHGHVWEPRQWLALGRHISRERERSAEERVV